VPGKAFDKASMNSYLESMNAILSEKGQVTIPKEARDLMDLRPGVVLRFEVEGGRLVATKEETGDPFAKWRGRGRLPRGLTADEYLRLAREGK
jgi:antitoxin PrlF